jgi:hypothetical protein
MKTHHELKFKGDRKETSLLFSNIRISQMMKTHHELKFKGVLAAEVNFKILQSKVVESG